MNGLTKLKLLELDTQTRTRVFSNYCYLRDELLKRKGYLTLAQCESLLIDELENAGIDVRDLRLYNTFEYDMNSKYGFVDFDVINNMEANNEVN